MSDAVFLVDPDLRKKYGVMVIAIKEGTQEREKRDAYEGSISLFPSPDIKLQKSMILDF